MDLENLKAKKNTLENRKAEAEVAFDGAEVGRIEQEIINLDQMITDLESKAEHTGEATESQVQQVEDLGSTKEILNEQTAEVDEKIAEVTTEAVDEMKKEGEINEIKISLDVIEKVKGFKSIKECNSSEEYKAYYEMKKVEIDEINEEIKQARSEFINSFLSNPTNNNLLKDYIEEKIKKFPFESWDLIRPSVEDVIRVIKKDSAFYFVPPEKGIAPIITSDDFYNLQFNNKEEVHEILNSFNKDINILINEGEGIRKELGEYTSLQAAELIKKEYSGNLARLVSQLVGVTDDTITHKIVRENVLHISNLNWKYAKTAPFEDILPLMIEKNMISSEEVKKGILDSINKYESLKKQDLKEYLNSVVYIIEHKLDKLGDDYQLFAKEFLADNLGKINESVDGSSGLYPYISYFKK